jgi:hypothetical protein
MKTFIMHRARGLLGPMVQKTSTSPSTVSSPKGVKSVGNYIVYKKNNP